MKDTLKATLNANLARVESLVATYESHPDASGRGRKGASVLDILRAAVVLMHASLEDLLRGVAAWKLPQAGKPFLDEIPLAGTGPTPRKFLLGDLAAYRGQRVDDVITSSVSEYLLRSNYNNTGEMSYLAQSVGVDVAKISTRFTGIQALMERRHQIVHRADRQPRVTGSGDHVVRAINKDTVRAWIVDVRSFADVFLAEL